MKNLASYIVNDTKPNQFNISRNGQFIIQRKIFSDIYPDFPDLITFKLYIYLCRSYEWRYQRVKKAKSEMQQDLNLNRSQLNNALGWLEAHYFIERTNSHKQQMFQAELLTAPDYDPFTNTYISCKSIAFHTSELKQRNQGYIMLPADAVTNIMLENTSTSDRIWTYTKLKVYLLLYGNCWLSYFGGVNPDSVHIESNAIHVEPSFYYNVKKSEKQVIKTIELLLSMDLFKVVKVGFIKGEYIGDSLVVPKSNGLKEHFVLRPYHLSEKKVKDKKLDNIRGCMIL